MSPEEEMNWVLGAVKEYAKVYNLAPEEIGDIFTEGTIHYAMPNFKSPLLEKNLKAKSEPVVSITLLRLEKEELKETLKWVPKCQVTHRDQLLDQMLAIDKQIEQQARQRNKIG